MKLALLFASSLVSLLVLSPTSLMAQPSTPAQHAPLNLITYEHKSPNQYATVLYMPYYPAYGMVSIKTDKCNAEIAGYIDPFSLDKNKLVINYKGCKVSFDISKNKESIINPSENEACIDYHPKDCKFTQIQSLKKVTIGTTP